ncbi:MAG: DDE-type integrase/transposase/recombinase [Gammaproteobacteria bacterium]|nr:DDE-type integrase/transposase/recombinase [Gammaproteobacteria bacterium]
MLCLLLYLVCVLFTRLLILNTFKRGNTCAAQRKSAINHTSAIAFQSLRFQAKPAWVKHEVMRLAALMPNQGCRKIADVFNRLYQSSRNMTVGRTFVANVMRDQQYVIQVLRKQIKHQPPKAINKQLIWGVDLTFKTDSQKQTHPIFGVVEHHSRKVMTLAALKDKAILTLLRCIFTAIECYGKPKIIRSDNEAVFTSRVFTISLWLLGIRHQTIEKHCPWQNGRIERFFGTLKQQLKRWPIHSFEQLARDLPIFQFWYNTIRTHNNLNGRTPDEVWNGVDIHSRPVHDVFYFNAWDGLLTGFYRPP